MTKSCEESTPRWFIGHWKDWHRGHGCSQDDGKDRSDVAVIEIEQHQKNKASGFLTDAELGFLRASTTSGSTLLVRALDELKARRVTVEHRAKLEAPGFLTEAELRFLRASATSGSELLVRALNELKARRSVEKHKAEAEVPP